MRLDLRICILGRYQISWGHEARQKLSYIYQDIGQYKPQLKILKITSVLHNLPSVGSKQLCALAHPRCTHEAGTS